VKKIIFSIWCDFSNHNQPAWVAEQWKKYKKFLINKHEEYAKICEADYKIFDIEHKKEINFIDLNFLKIHLAKQLTNDYEKVLYLDLDVIPKTKINFFKYHNDNFDKFLCHKTLGPRWKIEPKKMILAAEGINSPYNIINTGVFGLTKDIANMIDLEKHEKEIYKNYPDIPRNNEIYMSYIIEKYKIPCHEIGMGWNFVCDYFEKKPTNACHFLHISHKDFDSILES
jgi:hypothetical protein